VLSSGGIACQNISEFLVVRSCASWLWVSTDLSRRIRYDNTLALALSTAE